MSLEGECHRAIALSNGCVVSLSFHERVLRLLTKDGEGVIALADDRILSWGTNRIRDRNRYATLRLWSPDGEALTELEGHTEVIRGACELTDKRLLSWSEDRTLRLWDADGAPLAVLEGHAYPINGALQLMDGRLLS